LFADGSYHLPPRTAADEPRRSQTEFIQIAIADNISSGKNAKPRAKYPQVSLKPSPFTSAKE